MLHCFYTFDFREFWNCMSIMDSFQHILAHFCFGHKGDTLDYTCHRLFRMNLQSCTFVGSLRVTNVLGVKECIYHQSCCLFSGKVFRESVTVDFLCQPSIGHLADGHNCKPNFEACSSEFSMGFWTWRKIVQQQGHLV